MTSMGWIVAGVLAVSLLAVFLLREMIVEWQLTRAGKAALRRSDVATAKVALRELRQTTSKSGALNELLRRDPKVVRKIDELVGMIDRVLGVQLVRRPSMTKELVLVAHAHSGARGTRVPLERALDGARRRGVRIERLSSEEATELARITTYSPDEIQEASHVVAARPDRADRDAA